MNRKQARSEMSITYLFEIYDIVYDSQLFNNDSIDDTFEMFVYMGAV